MYNQYHKPAITQQSISSDKVESDSQLSSQQQSRPAQNTFVPKGKPASRAPAPDNQLRNRKSKELPKPAGDNQITQQTATYSVDRNSPVNSPSHVPVNSETVSQAQLAKVRILLNDEKSLITQTLNQDLRQTFHVNEQDFSLEEIFKDALVETARSILTEKVETYLKKLEQVLEEYGINKQVAPEIIAALRKFILALIDSLVQIIGFYVLERAKKKRPDSEEEEGDDDEWITYLEKLVKEKSELIGICLKEVCRLPMVQSNYPPSILISLAIEVFREVTKSIETEENDA